MGKHRATHRVLCFLISLWIIGGMTEAALADADGDLSAALQLAAQQDYTDAVPALQAVAATYPNTPQAGRALHQLGLIYITKYKDQDCLAAVDRGLAMQLPPEVKGPLAMLKVSVLVNRLGKDEEAIRVAEEALASSDVGFTPWDRANTVIYMVYGYEHLGQRDKARDVFDKQLPLSPALLDSDVFYQHLMDLEYWDGPRRGENVLAFAASALGLCPYNADMLRKIMSLVAESFGRQNRLDLVEQFLASQRDPAAENPLFTFRTWPNLTEQQLQAMTALAEPDARTKLTMLLLRGEFKRAMLLAVRNLAAAPTGTVPQAANEVARVFKAQDLSLIRANEFLAYARTGQGNNPLDGFWQEAALPPDQRPPLVLGAGAQGKTPEQLLQVRETVQPLFLGPMVEALMCRNRLLQMQRRWPAPPQFAEEFASWADLQSVSREGLVEAMESIEKLWPMDWMAEPLAAALYRRLNGEVRAMMELPLKPRIIMMTHVGLLGKDDDLRQMWSAVTKAEEENEASLRPILISSLAICGHEQGQLTCIWGWKYRYELTGRADDAAGMCAYMMSVCEQRKDPDLARREMIPWAEQVLANPSSMPYWWMGVPALLRAYMFVGEPDKVIESGRVWLARLPEVTKSAESFKGGVCYEMGRAYIARKEFQPVVDMLKEAIATNSESAADGLQWLLLEARKANAQLGDEVVLLPPKLHDERMQPKQVEVHPGLIAWVYLPGNPTLQVKGTNCDLGFVKVTVDEFNPGRWSQFRLKVECGQPDQPGKHKGTITIETNEAARPKVTVPIIVTDQPEGN